MELKRLGESMDTMLEHLTCLHFVLPQGYVENLKINCMLYIYISDIRCPPALKVSVYSGTVSNGYRLSPILQTQLTCGY